MGELKEKSKNHKYNNSTTSRTQNGDTNWRMEDQLPTQHTAQTTLTSQQ